MEGSPEANVPEETKVVSHSLSAVEPPVPSVEERWNAYLDSICARQVIGAAVVLAAKSLLSKLRESVVAITSPDAGPTNTGGLLMSWDRSGMHLEIEILPDASYDWFFRQRALDITDGGDGYLVEGEIPGGLARRLETMLT